VIDDVYHIYIDYCPSNVKSVFVLNRGEPIVVVKSVSSAVRFDSLTKICLSWTVCRALYNGSFTVPDGSGWVSATADISEPVQLSNIGYLTPIQLPITQVVAAVEKGRKSYF